METQLPEGLVGEKLAELEKGNYTSAIKEDVPLTPPKFITQVHYLLSTFRICLFTLIVIYRLRALA
jgi:hypothetical protein